MKTTVYYNGKIYVEKGVFAQAMVVKDEYIDLVGTDAEALACSYDEKVDLEGKTVVPGFNDSHMHLLSVGTQMTRPNISVCRSIGELIEVCREFISNNPEATKGGLHAMGWNQDNFTDDKRMPTRKDIDKISTDIPIVLERVCGHILVTNTKVIEMLGLDSDSPQYEGGEFSFGEDGYPDGLFRENACGYAESVLPDASKAEIKSAFNAAASYAVSHGLTSVQSNDIHLGENGGGIETYEVLKELHKEGFPLRYRGQVCFSTPEVFSEYISKGFFGEKYEETDTFTLGALKLFKDGSLGARTALLEGEYADDPGNSGIEAMSPETMDAYVSRAAEAGITVSTHVIGDKAAADTLTSYEKFMPAGDNPLRHSLIHFQISDMPLIERASFDKVPIQYQPVFLEYDLHIVEDRVGTELAKTSYAYKTVMEKGCLISMGTDSPVEDCDPMKNLFCAVTRKDYGLSPDGGWNPGECLDVSDAIDAYTAGSAAFEFAEGYKGRIKAGFLADFAVLETDVFTCPKEEIKDIEVALTVMNGKEVYKKTV